MKNDEEGNLIKGILTGGIVLLILLSVGFAFKRIASILFSTTSVNEQIVEMLKLTGFLFVLAVVFICFILLKDGGYKEVFEWFKSKFKAIGRNGKR